MAKREGSWFRQISGRTFYWVLKKLSGMDIPPNLLMARLMTQQYVEHLVAHDEHVFSIEGLWYLTGYEQVPITVEKLYKGSTTYTLNKRIALAVKSITAVSNQPLLYITYLGLFITIPSGLYILLLLAQYATGYISNVSGWASLIISVWFLGGLIIFILGIISIYLSIIFVETKNRPYTLVRDVFRQVSDETQDTSSQSTQL
jgi:putative glycosyltransferase